MNQRLALAGTTGIALLMACGSQQKLGDGNQASEGSGGGGGQDSQLDGGSVNQAGRYGGGGIAGSYGGQGADPSFGGGSLGGGAYGGIPGAGGVAYGGVAGAGNYGAGAYPGGSFGLDGGGSVGGGIGAGGQTTANTGGYPPQSTPGIGLGGGPLLPDGGVGTTGADLTGTWTGYVENHTFKSGSDALLLAIAQGANGLDGRITFGLSSGPLASATELVLPGGTYPEALWEPLEGFTYTALNGRVMGSRLVFDVAPQEAWDSICRAQTSCDMSQWTSDWSTACWKIVNGQQQLDDCGTMAVCSAACACDPGHCFANTGTRLVHFDVALRFPYLDGSVSRLNESSVLNVHFSPQ